MNNNAKFVIAIIGIGLTLPVSLFGGSALGPPEAVRLTQKQARTLEQNQIVGNALTVALRGAGADGARRSAAAGIASFKMYCALKGLRASHEAAGWRALGTSYLSEARSAFRTADGRGDRAFKLLNASMTEPRVRPSPNGGQH